MKGKGLSVGRVAVVADVHLGLRGGLVVGDIHDKGIVGDRASLSFHELYYWLKEKKLQSLVIAGDLFNSPTVAPKIVAAVRKLIQDASWKGFSTLAFPGNHDWKERPGNGIRYIHDEPIESVRVERVADGSNTSPSTYMGIVPMVPGVGTKEALELLRESDDFNHYKPRVILGHFGIVDSTSPFWERSDPSSIGAKDLGDIFKDTGVKLIAAGHYHSPRWWFEGGIDVVQIGALSPCNVGEAGTHYGNVLEIRGTADGPFWWKVHYGAVSGVRYFTNEAPEEIPQDISRAAFKRCWCILRDVDDLSFFERTFTYLEKPEDCMLTFGKYSVIDYHRSDGHTKRLRAVADVNPKQAVRRYIRKNLPGRPGLLSESVDRLTRSTIVREFVAPDWMRLPNGTVKTYFE